MSGYELANERYLASTSGFLVYNDKQTLPVESTKDTAKFRVYFPLPQSGTSQYTSAKANSDLIGTDRDEAGKEYVKGYSVYINFIRQGIFFRMNVKVGIYNYTGLIAISKGKLGGISSTSGMSLSTGPRGMTMIIIARGVLFDYTLGLGEGKERDSISNVVVIDGVARGKNDVDYYSPSARTLLSEDKCPSPRIALFMSTGGAYSLNIVETVMRASDRPNKEWTKVPCLTRVTRPRGICTLIEKLLSLRVSILTYLEYAGLRYFLWFLTTGKWNTSILLQRNTRRFYRELAKGPYALWSVYLNQARFSGYEKIFY